MRIDFQNIGWRSKVALKRATFTISINKMVAIGSSISKGKELYCYLAKDESERPMMVVYLDGLPRENELMHDPELAKKYYERKDLGREK